MIKNEVAEQRLNFGHFVDRMFWAILIGIATFMAHSINDLNEKVAVAIEHMSYSDKRADAQEKRIERLEEQGR